jgi:WD40 repeat protein
MQLRTLRKGIVSAILLFPLFATTSLALKDAPLPPPANVEEARQRLAYLQDASKVVDQWVEWNWGTEFDRSYPGLSRAPLQGSAETPEAFKERQMKVRIGMSEVKGRLRLERAEWVVKEKERLLAAEIPEPFPVKLGPYDTERKRFPLLLGFGWPSGLSISLRIPDQESKAFEARFPATLPAVFRVNEQGEVHLLSIEKCWDPGVHDVYAAPPGPRLAWQASHDSWVTAVAFLPDGSEVISAGGDSVLAGREAESGNPVFRIEKAELAMSVACSPDGTEFATGGSDSVLHVRRTADGKELWNVVVGKGMIMATAYSNDGRYVAIGDDTGYLKVYNTKSGEEKFKVEAGMPIRSIDFTKGGKGIVIGGEGRRVQLWDFGSDRIVWRKNTEWPVYAVSASPAGGLVAVGGGGRELVVLRETDGTDAWSAKTEGEVRSLRFDPAGRLLAAGGAGYTVKVFPANGGAAVWTAEIGNPIRALAFGADGRKLFVGSAEGGLRMFNIDEADRVQAAFGAPGRIYIERKLIDTLFR